MQHLLHPRVRKAHIGGLLATALIALCVLPAAASAACPTSSSSKVFSQFGDFAYYSLVPNGHFESGTGGWSLTRAKVVSGNESYKVRSNKDSKSLAIDPNGQAISPSLCVSAEHPTFRFFARRTSGTWGVLKVSLRWKDAAGGVNETDVGSLSGDPFTSWLPSPVLPLATTLPLWQSGSTLSVRLVFDPENFGGAWTIDDVYVDPYRR